MNISGLDQLISYEGIHKLCFSCGRIGHRKDNYVYLLRATSPKEKAYTDAQSNMERADMGMQGNAERTTCMAQEGVVPTHTQGEGDTVQVGSIGTMDEESYGPWVVVTRKKSGRKGPNIGSTSASKASKQEWVNSQNRANDFSGPNNKAKEDGLGLKREGKRKADLVVIGKRTNGPGRVGQAGGNVSKGDMLKTKANESVRGKKGITRLRVFSNREATAFSPKGSLYPIFSLTNIAKPNIDPNFQFSTSLENKMGEQLSRDRGGEPVSRDGWAMSGSNGQVIGEAIYGDNAGFEHPVEQ